MENLYTSLKIEWELKEDLEEPLQGERIVSTDLTRLGTKRPFWEASFSKNKVTVNVVVPFEKGSKASFLSKESEGGMLEELGLFCPDLKKKIVKNSFSMTSEVWVEDKKIKFYKKPEEISFYPAADIFDLSKVGKKKKT